MDQLRKDIGFAVRMLLKRPALSLITILTFSLGIGVTTTVFSLVNGALYKGLPFPEGDRIMVLGETEPARDIDFRGVGVHDFVEWREQQTSFESLAAFDLGTVNLAGSEGRPERFAGAFTTANLFEVLRVRPALGRLLREGDDRPGAEPVIVIGFDVWQDRYGSSPDVIGRTVRANGVTRTIVGVAPDGFRFPYQEELWIPQPMDPGASERGEGTSFLVSGRLREGVSRDEARAEMATIARRLEQEYPETNEGIGATVQTFPELLDARMAAMLYTMLGAVIGVLLIASPGMRRPWSPSERSRRSSVLASASRA